MKMRNKPVGIIGGMGPDASARLYQIMIDMAREEYGARLNEDYPEIVLQSIPVPDFISNTKKAGEALVMLKDRVRRLSKLSLSCMGMACNSAHIIVEELEKVNGERFVSIPEEVAKEAKGREYKRVGLLASPTTIFSGVYQTELLNKGIEVELPDNGYIQELGEIIIKLVAGNKRVKGRLMKIVNSLKRKKVETIILGCTELSLVFPKNYDLPVLDSVIVLARALLRKYYKE